MIPVRRRTNLDSRLRSLPDRSYTIATRMSPRLPRPTAADAVIETYPMQNHIAEEQGSMTKSMGTVVQEATIRSGLLDFDLNVELLEEESGQTIEDQTKKMSMRNRPAEDSKHNATDILKQPFKGPEETGESSRINRNKKLHLEVRRLMN